MDCKETSTDDTETHEDKGCHRWFIVVSAFFIGFLTDGLVLSFGVLLVEFLEEFQDERAATTIIGSLTAGVMYLVGPLAGLLSDVLGGRAVVIIGTLISFAGFLGASFANGLITLSVSYGFIGGLGFGLMFLPPSAYVIQHFKKRRALATGIAVCGSGVGNFVNSLLIRYLIDMYTWRKAILVIAGMVLHGIPCGLLLVSSTQRDEGPKEKLTEEKNDCDVKQRKVRFADMANCKDVLYKNIRLLLDFRYICFFLSTFVVNLAFIIPYAFLPDQAVDTGMTKYQGSWLVSSIGIANTISRVIFGWLADKKFVNRILLFEILLLLIGINTAISPVLTSFEAKLAYSCVHGFFIGGYVTLIPVVLADMYGSQLIEESFGLAMFAIGIGVMISLPFGGWIIDKTGSYNITFVVAGSEFAFGGLVLLCPLGFRRLRQHKSADITSRIQR